MTVAGVVTSADAQAAAERLLTRLGPRVGQRFALLLSSGVGVDELERETDTLVAAMEKMLPAPSVPAQVSGPVWTTGQVRVALGRPGGAPVSRQAVDDRVRRGTLLALRVAEHSGPTRCGSSRTTTIGGRCSRGWRRCCARSRRRSPTVGRWRPGCVNPTRPWTDTRPWTSCSSTDTPTSTCCRSLGPPRPAGRREPPRPGPSRPTTSPDQSGRLPHPGAPAAPAVAGRAQRARQPVVVRRLRCRPVRPDRHRAGQLLSGHRPPRRVAGSAGPGNVRWRRARR